MTEAVQPDQVRSAEQIELSAREAASGVTPRDAGSWAAKVDRLAVEQRAGVRGTNVAGRRLTGPVQGFGKMWQKTYRLTVPGDITPEQAIATWKAHFPEFWPAGNRFAGALTGISPGDVALLDLAIGGGVKLSTGVFVLYADDRVVHPDDAARAHVRRLDHLLRRTPRRGHCHPGSGADAGQ